MTSLSRRGYGLEKSSISENDLKELRDTFTVKPHSVMITKDSDDKIFPVYQESSSKIYIPKAYGLHHFGNPHITKLDIGEDINLEFIGTLRPEQQAPVDAYLKAAQDNRKRGGIINLQCAGGKCLGHNTPIMMFDGRIKKVQDIVVGDVIMGDDSTPRNILSTCQGRETMYKIIQSQGDPYIVNESHILSLKLVIDNKETIIDIPLVKYLELPEYKKKQLFGYKVPIKFQFRKVNCCPYLVGTLLGCKYPNNIPNEYKFNSDFTRITLLAGLIDTFGTYDEINTRFDVIVQKKELMIDVLFLVRSLGFASQQHEEHCYIYGIGIEHIPTKKIHAKPFIDSRSVLLTDISVEKLAEDNYYGFEIDGNRRFVMGDFTVTHNTVIALYIISRLQKKTMIVVHKEFLLDQWKERINQFLPRARIGYIKGPLCDVKDKDIIIGSLQSLSMKNYDNDVFDGIALCVYDEIHHTAAQVFSRIFRKLTTLYTLGLSATVNRKDGLTKVFKWYVGNIVYKGGKKKDNMKVIIKEYLDPSHGYCRELKMFNKQPNMPKMLNNICDYLPRTRFIIQCLKEVLDGEKNRKVLILSDRRNHLEIFNKLLTEQGIESGFYYGGLKTEILQESEKKQVLLGTYAYVSEGFDLPGLNTMILASPKSDVIQSVGRILRDKPECRKYQALVIDIIDNFSIFPNQGRKRIKYYQSQDYEIHHDKLFDKEAGFKLNGKCCINYVDE